MPIVGEKNVLSGAMLDAHRTGYRQIAGLIPARSNNIL